MPGSSRVLRSPFRAPLGAGLLAAVAATLPLARLGAQAAGAAPRGVTSASAAPRAGPDSARAAAYAATFDAAWRLVHDRHFEPLC